MIKLSKLFPAQGWSLKGQRRREVNKQVDITGAEASGWLCQLLQLLPRIPSAEHISPCSTRHI